MADAVDADDGRSDRRKGSWRIQKLAPGPGRSRAEVRSHQRARLHAAMIDLVVEEDYNALTVRRLSRRAHISSGAFYSHFTSTDDCFLKTFELILGRTSQRLLEAGADQRGPRRRLEVGFETLARDSLVNAQAARFVLIAAPTAGPAPIAHMRSSAEMVGRAIEALLGRRDCCAPAKSLIREATVAGLARIARARLLSGREHELPALGREAADWVISLYGGDGVEVLQPRLQPQGRGGQHGSAAAEARPANDLAAPSDERAMILTAAARLAASEGYGALSVPKIRRAAGVSRKAFDGYFDGVEDCFLAALDARVEGALLEATSQARRLGASGAKWPEAVHRWVEALCARIERDPLRARTSFVEVFAAGRAGIRKRSGLIDETAQLLRSSAPARQRPTALAAEASVAAIWALLHRYVEEERATDLSQLVPLLTYVLLAPAIGNSEAKAGIRAARARQQDEAASQVEEAATAP